MTPLTMVLLSLAALYLLGREFDRYAHNVRHAILTPSRVEHLAPDEYPDEPMDTWAACWDAALLEDELERWASLPTFDPEARA